MPGHVDTDPSDGFDGLSLPRSFRFLARAGLEKRNVTGHHFDQVMNEDHFRRPLEVDLVLQVAVQDHRHECHLPGVLGHAFPAAVG